MEQVWFPGVHCSVGGGDTYRGLSTISLCWMAHKITRHTNLALDLDYVVASLRTFEPEKNGVRLNETPAGWACTPWDESYVGIYRLGGRRARKPGRYHKIKDGETTNEYVHHSVQVRQNNLFYTPPPVSELPPAEFDQMEVELRDRIWSSS